MGIYDDKFGAWYKNDNDGSGPGSVVEATAEWRKFLDEFIKVDPRPSIILDFGCGDWQFSRLIEWHGARYIGIDVSLELIRRLNKTYRGPKTQFYLFDPELETPAEIINRVAPDGVDLIICKDVIQHLPNKESVEMVSAMVDSCYHLLLVNDMRPGSDNIDGPICGCRHIDPRQAPFSYENAKIVFDFNNDKTAFLISGKREK